MAVDKKLFKYDLAVVAILYNEGHYLKEWLDYHLLAGVDHFYLYDHESTDDYNEIIKPYVENGLVTTVYYSGKVVMMAAYNDAIQKYKCDCRYMAFIDGDEYIFPKSNKNIVEVLDEVFEKNPNIAGLGMNWQIFGSSHLEKADYTRGVLDRFIYRAEKDYAPGDEENRGVNAFFKTVANPRKINLTYNPHFSIYFEGHFAVNSDAEPIRTWFSFPVKSDKIVLNHYRIKSLEEYTTRKMVSGDAYYLTLNQYDMETFHNWDFNDEFDDGIIKYRDARINELLNTGGGGVNVFEILAASKRIDYDKIFTALIRNLSPTFGKNISPEFFVGKMENFLTCFSVSASMKNNVLDETAGKFFEEVSLNAIFRTLLTNVSVADVRLLLRELPKILPLNYPVTENIRLACISIIPRLMEMFRLNNMWKDYMEMQYIMDMLTAFNTKK